MRQGAAIRLVGGRVLGDDGLRDRDLVVQGGIIADDATGPVRDLPVKGLMVMPGLVDLHGDGFERQLAPRRGMVTDLERGLHAVQTDLAAAGITTGWLAQFWSWEGGMRGPDFARRLAAALDRARPTLRLDMRLQLRLERAMVDDGNLVRALVSAHGIDYIVFNDHLPYDRLDTGQTPQRLVGSAGKAGRSPQAHLTEMHRLAANRAAVPGFVSEMAQALRAQGVTLGSHDDADARARETWGALGLRIAEFPVTREAAEAARARGEPVVLGAPNVVRGGSHKRGGMAAEALIADGLVDALASDYYYPAMAQAAFDLVDRRGLGLAAAWRLISAGPAEIMGLHDRGRIASGQRADLVLLDAETRHIEGVFCAGRPVLASSGFAEALLS